MSAHRKERAFLRLPGVMPAIGGVMLFLHLFGLLFSLFRLTSAPAGDPPADDPQPERTRATDVLARYGDNVVRMAEKVAELEGDLYKARRSRDDYKRTNDELTKKVTPDGALVLTGEDATLWEAYKGLGKPDEVKTKLADADTAITERDSLKRGLTVRQVAEVSGYKPAVLERLLGDQDLPIIKDVQETVNGKPTTVKRAFVVKDGKEVPLADHAKTEWADFLPALGATEQAPPLYGTPPRDNKRGTPPVEMADTPLTHIRL